MSAPGARATLGGSGWSVPPIPGALAREMYLDARDYGAKGDGVNDDTAALQLAITAVCTGESGKALFIAAGVYKITAPLTVPFGTGWVIRGEGRGRTIIRQATDNTQILRFTGDLTHSWSIEDVGFEHSTQQAGGGSAPNAVGIYFDSGNNTNIFNCCIQRCTFKNSYRGIAINPSANQLAVWGVWVRDVIFGGDLTGAGLRLQCNTAVGQPNINLDNVYVDAADATEPSIQITSGTGVNLRGVEFNNGTYNAFAQMDIGSSTAVSLLNCRSEAATVSAAGTKTLWSFPNSDVVAVGCQFASPVCSGGGILRAIHAGTNGRLSLIGGEFNGTRGDGGSLVPYNADNLEAVFNVQLNGGWLRNIRTVLGNVPMPRADTSFLQPDCTQTRGDANVTLTSAGYRYQYFNQTLTANRTITLPNTGLVDGIEFHVIRYAGTPGAFTLQVVDPVSSKNYTIASGTKGFARYRAVGSGEWLLIEAGTFP